ncbi:MAG: aminoglycoside phosphotransferase family protein [Clostridium sp.]|nr:aminoglycoside phosphotransferase family protein [Clostridium sp.]
MITQLPIIEKFDIEGRVSEVKPLGEGLINDTFVVRTEGDTPDYVLQRVNHHVFTDVEGLQHNIEAVTRHIRAKLTAAGADDIDRRVLRFIPLKDSEKTYWYDADNDAYWRMMVFIPDTQTFSAVTPDSARDAGRAFGNFQSMLVDIPDHLVETIPDFHNMELRLRQLREAAKADKAGRLDSVRDIYDELISHADEMCLAERLHREGKLPKRICHCDTKVNNMLFDRYGNVLCVIDLDTVMPSFIFSDFGDFMRTGANTGAEDDADPDRVNFNLDIFRAFSEGYLAEARSFLTPVEIENLPYAAMLFPYMQAVRFFADYLNGDTYYKIQYPEHNLVRTRAQLKLFNSARRQEKEMKSIINELTNS